MKINESVVSGDIASLCGYGMSPLALSASSIQSSIQPSIQPSVTGAVPIKTAAINKRAPRAQKIFKTVDADGSIFGHYVRPSFNTTTLQWESPKRALLGVAQFSQDVDPIKMAALSIIETAESDINSKETFIRSGYFDAIKLFESKENPNLMEGAHFRSIYFSKNYEFEIPSIFRFAAIDDSGDVNIFTSRPNYLTTGCWSGKGQTLIANAKWSENYAFPIIASNLLLKLFGQSRLDSIAPKVMVSSWEIFENALDKMWEDYDIRCLAGLRNNLFNSGIEGIPGATPYDYGDAADGGVLVEDARGQWITFGNVDYGVPPTYIWACVDSSGAIALFKNEPRFRDGNWRGRARFEIGNCEFYPGTTEEDAREMVWKISNVSAQKFLSYRNHIIKKIHIDKVLLRDIWSMSENDISLNEKVVKLRGDEIELPDSYEYAAVDMNTDLCIFKEEPKLQGGKWSGKGKKQIGVCVWDFSKLDGSPTTMDKAEPKIKKIISRFKFKMKDGGDLHKTLEDTNSFKYFFGKYDKIEKLTPN